MGVLMVVTMVFALITLNGSGQDSQIFGASSCECQEMTDIVTEFVMTGHEIDPASTGIISVELDSDGYSWGYFPGATPDPFLEAFVATVKTDPDVVITEEGRFVISRTSFTVFGFGTESLTIVVPFDGSVAPFNEAGIQAQYREVLDDLEFEMGYYAFQRTGSQ